MVYPSAPFKVLYLQVIQKGRMKRKSETLSGAYSTAPSDVGQISLCCIS